MQSHSVIVIGAGQAGLSVARCLQQRGLQPLLLERSKVAHSWRQERWDSFTLVTPNWQCKLPGFSYDGDDPEGFMGRDAVVGFLERFAAAAPALQLREGVNVTRLERLSPTEGGAFVLHTSEGPLQAAQVVIATGGYHRPRRHSEAGQLPRRILQLDARNYRNAEALPEGPVLVVGSGQSGSQIAEDLFFSGRRVHLSVGSAPRSPRRYRGRDVVEWLDRMGHYSRPIDDHDDPAAVRSKTNHYLTGRDGGREINLRQHASDGLNLHGRLSGIDSKGVAFADDLGRNLDHADAVHARIRSNIDTYIEQQGIEAPPHLEPPPCWHPPQPECPTHLDADTLAAVVWATGYQLDYSWVDLPMLDGSGTPIHQRGITPVEGLYVLGLPWLHTWGSGRFCGVAADAEHIADRILERAHSGDLHQEWRNSAALLGR